MQYCSGIDKSVDYKQSLCISVVKIVEQKLCRSVGGGGLFHVSSSHVVVLSNAARHFGMATADIKCSALSAQ